MESIGELLNEEFGVGFGADCEITTTMLCVEECTLSLVIFEAGGESAKIELEGTFKYLPRRSL